LFGSEKKPSSRLPLLPHLLVTSSWLCAEVAFTFNRHGPFCKVPGEEQKEVAEQDIKVDPELNAAAWHHAVSDAPVYTVPRALTLLSSCGAQALIQRLAEAKAAELEAAAGTAE
jgi:hypothetical protein